MKVQLESCSAASVQSSTCGKAALEAAVQSSLEAAEVQLEAAEELLTAADYCKQLGKLQYKYSYCGKAAWRLQYIGAAWSC